MKLVDLEVYKDAMKIADQVYFMVKSWEDFERNTIGKQIVNAVDSIAANVSEGFGRYHYKENKLFCYYSRGSLTETKTWLEKAHNRGLITTENCDKLVGQLDILHKKLNGYINSIGTVKYS